MYYRKSKEERKAWWNSLSLEERAAYVRKRAGEAEDDEEDRPDISYQMAKDINDTMKAIGMEKFTVLSNSPEDYEY